MGQHNNHVLSAAGFDFGQQRRKVRCLGVKQFGHTYIGADFLGAFGQNRHQVLYPFGVFADDGNIFKAQFTNDKF